MYRQVKTNMCNQTWRIRRQRSYLDKKNGRVRGERRRVDYDFYFVGFEFELKGARIEREEKDKVERGWPRDARKRARASGSNFRTWNSKRCVRLAPAQPTTKPIFQSISFFLVIITLLSFFFISFYPL